MQHNTSKMTNSIQNNNKENTTMKSSISTTCRIHRSAIALNNIGVSFLRRGNYRNSLNSFTKAFLLMEHLSKQSDPVRCQQQQQQQKQEEEVEEKEDDDVGDEDKVHEQDRETAAVTSSFDDLGIKFLTKASQQLARSTSCQKVQRCNSDKYNIRVIELDTESDFEVLQDIVWDEIPTASTSTSTSTTSTKCNSPAAGTAIWIEVLDTTTNNDYCYYYNPQCEQFQLDCAIMLYNLGNACLLYELSNTSFTRNRRYEIYEKVMNICTGAYDILVNLYCMEQNDMFQSRRIGLLTMLVLHTLMKTASKMNHSNEVISDFEEQLNDIQSEITICNVSDIIHTVAAAQA